MCKSALTVESLAMFCYFINFDKVASKFSFFTAVSTLVIGNVKKYCHILGCLDLGSYIL
jgi:hypothetical protein